MANYVSKYTGAQIDEAVGKALSGTGAATVTATSIKTALGYTPANAADVEALEKELDSIGGAAVVPAYVVEEAERVVEAINAARTSQSLVLLCASDIHTLQSYATSTTATLHLAQGMNEICKRVPVDGIAILGDIAFGSSTSTAEETKFAFTYLRENLAKGEHEIWVPGNHDHRGIGANSSYLTADELYAYIGANTTDKAVMDYDNLHRMYGYVDYERQQIRVIYLNTADITDTYSSDYGVTTAQVKWLVDTLKAVPAGWGVVAMGHHPLDTSAGAATVILTILDAFKGKQSGTASSVSYDFTNAQGELICHLHGHIHNYKAANYGTNGVLSITIPNGYPGRDNEYGKDSNNAYWGEFDTSGNPIVYSKAAGTATDTAYTAVIIDRKNGVIYALRCGAGIDRTLVYSGDTVLYKVAMLLTNVTSNNTAASVVSGAAYTTTLTANAGYTLDTVEVFMGSTDITATAYANGKVTIAEVTGAITIRATAVATGGGDSGGTDNENNLVPTAQAMDSTAVYNGSGYKNDYRLSTDSPYESAATGYVATGLIPYSVPDTGVPGTIYIKGADWNEVSNCRMLFFSASKELLYPQIKGGGTEANMLATFYTLETLGSSYYKLAPIVNPESSSGTWVGPGITSRVKDAEFIRFSLAGSGNGLIITVDVPIE